MSRAGADVARGAAAGALGGVVAGAVKLLWEAAAPPRPPQQKAPPVVLVDRTLRERTGTGLAPVDEPKASFAVHFAFSTLTGAAYGAAAEVAPQVRALGGIALGVAVWAGAHEVALPALALAPPIADTPAYEQANELVSHALWGAALEAVRAIARG